MDLNWLTCMQKFGVPIQVVNMTCFHNYSKKRFGFKFKLELRYIIDYTIESM
jgi:hypothetical protein